MQYELEDITEKLSEMLQRQYQAHLRASKRMVQQATQYCLQKRTDFLKAIYSGLQWKDPWMNRNWGGNFNTLGHRSRKSKEDRQIWTKTLSYPNKWVFEILVLKSWITHLRFCLKVIDFDLGKIGV